MASERENHFHHFGMNSMGVNPSTARAAIGKAANEDGHSFELRVADVYRLLHYDVQHGRLFGGRQVDLFLRGDFGDLVIYRAIECKLGTVRSEHIDAFIARLRLVRKEYPSAQGTIISAVSFTDAVSTQAAAEGVHLVLFRDLVAALLDGHSYAKSLKHEIESSSRYPLSHYIQQTISYQFAGSGLSAMEVVQSWLRAGDWQQLTLLGDVGTGKSFLCRMIAYRLVMAYLEDPINQPLPILIDLRNVDREFSLEGLILTHFARNGLRKVSFEAFQHALAEGNAILIFDGFDEMSVRVTPQVSQRNFVELMACIKGKAKVLLSCRTHYFKSRSEEEEIVLGSNSDYGLNTAARELYWELISRSGFRIAYLQPFTFSQIEEYVSRVRPRTATKDLHKIRSTYNLLELSQRPMLLEMIVKSLDRIASDDVNPAELYKVYTDAWIHRDRWRDALSPQKKLEFVVSLARMLWISDAVVVHHTELSDFVQRQFGPEIQNLQHFLEIDSDVRTAAFLTRNESGHYGFAHKSYGEFFLARFIADRLTAGELGSLNMRRITPEVVSFLRHLVDRKAADRIFESILCEPYLPNISENALVCLYYLRRADSLEAHDSGGGSNVHEFRVLMPRNAQLASARLEQVVLEGACLIAADFSNALLDQAILSGTELDDAAFRGASLQSADLSGSRCCGVDFTGANLSRSNFTKADLTDAILSANALADSLFAGAVLGDNWDLLHQAAGGEEPEFEGQVEFPGWLADLIVSVEPRIRKIARVLGYPAYLEIEEIASEVCIRLTQPKRLEIVRSLDVGSREAYVISFTFDLMEQLNSSNHPQPLLRAYDEYNPWKEYDYLDGMWSEYYPEYQLSSDSDPWYPWDEEYWDDWESYLEDLAYIEDLQEYDYEAELAGWPDPYEDED